MNEAVNKNIYTCPMHPDVKSDKPGLCQKCGMNLVPVKTKGRHDPHPQAAPAAFNKHGGHETNVFKTKFWISLILTIPVVIYADLIQQFFGYQAPAFFGSTYLQFVLSSVIFFYGGWIFLASAYRELKARLPGMMTLISLAITTAYTYSVYVTLTAILTTRPLGATLYWELSTLITVMLLGHWLEMRAVSGAQSALKELSKLLPDEAEVIRGETTQLIPLSEVKINDLILVKPGGKIPTDGLVIEGGSDVNEAIATGESRPVAKKQGDEVIAGTINGDGALKVKVTKIGAATFLAGVMRLVAEAQASKSRLQMLSDRAAYFLTLIAVSTGGLTLVVWLATASPAFAVERMVAVLVIACPHALGLAIPLVASVSTTKAARNGFLVKQRLALEAARKVDTVIFDKTGTLTKGEFGVEKIIAADAGQEQQTLLYAAAVNSQSEHPLAKAIVAEAKKQNLKLPAIKNFSRLPGKGIKAEIEGQLVMVGSQTLANEVGAKTDDAFTRAVDELAKRGRTINFTLVNNKVIGAIALADVIREESKEAIKTLNQMGVKTAMITGDAEDVAKWVADELGIKEYFARVLPGEKSDRVKQLQARGEKIAMVGDGVNDAPALTQADIGIAIGAGTNVAIESAGIILVKNDPRDIPKIIRLSRFTYAKMWQNLFWAAGYNIVAIPLAAGVLAFKGILLQPALAALLMSLSTVIVAINAMLLKRRQL